MITETSLVTAKDISDFAGRNQARSLLPHVVRKLLTDTPGIRGLSMPAGDEVWRDGWDGCVEHSDGHTFVPAGSLRWEMSTAKNPRQKAEQDYQKRTANPLGDNPSQTTFIFVTMRYWRDKKKWAQRKCDEGIWFDVRAMDAEDLWAWLESNSEVHAWLSQKMGRRPNRKTSQSKSPAQLPAEDNSFVGRSGELQQLFDKTNEFAQGALVVISGQPGVGKTSLAVRFAHQQKSAYRDGQIYIDLRGTDSNPLTTETILTRILRTLNVPSNQQGSSTDEMAASFRTAAAHKCFVLVLDNASDEQQVRSLTPGNSESLVIVTSRDQLGGLNCIERIRLGTLSEADAFAMLVAKIGSDQVASEPDSVARIAQLCGFLPLALQIASRLAEQAPSWSLEHLAGRLSDEQSRLDRLKIGDLEVRSSFRLSYELLSNKERIAFRNLCLIPGPTFDASLAKATLGYKKISQVESIIQLMVDRGLVQISAMEGRHRIHDLLRIFGAERTDEEDSDESQDETIRSACAYLLQGAKDATLALQPGIEDDRARKVRESVHPGDALLWLDLNFDNLVSVLHHTATEGLDDSSLSGLFTLGTYLELRAEWTKLREIALLGHDVLGRVKSRGTYKKHVIDFFYSSVHTMLAKSAHGLRNYQDALYYCDQADEPTGYSEQDRFNSSNTQNIRGLILRSLNRHEEALEALKECEHFWRSKEVPHQLHLVEHNIGATLMDIGKLDEALPYLYRDLEGCQNEGDALGEAHALNTIGLAWGRLAEFDTAVDMLTRSAIRYRSQNDQVHEGYALNDLGLMLHKQKEYGTAYKCHLIDLAYCHEQRDWHGAARALIRLADNLISADNCHAATALQYVKVALGYLNEEADRHAFAASLLILGDLGYVLSQAEDADRNYRTAIDIYHELGDFEGQLESYVRKSQRLQEINRAEDVLATLDAAISLTREYDRPFNEAQLWREVAEIRLEQEATGEAAEALEKANQLIENRRRPTPEEFSHGTVL